MIHAIGVDTMRETIIPPKDYYEDEEFLSVVF